MKITLSKNQWEEIGKKAGWKKAGLMKGPELNFDLGDKTLCKRCKGNRFIEEKIKTLGTGEYRWSTEVCPLCKGKGYMTKEDMDEAMASYMHSMTGAGKCPGDCPNCK